MPKMVSRNPIKRKREEKRLAKLQKEGRLVKGIEIPQSAWQPTLTPKIIKVAIQQNSIIKIFTILVPGAADRESGRLNNKKSILKSKRVIFITSLSGVTSATQVA